MISSAAFAIGVQQQTTVGCLQIKCIIAIVGYIQQSGTFHIQFFKQCDDRIYRNILVDNIQIIINFSFPFFIASSKVGIRSPVILPDASFR